MPQENSIIINSRTEPGPLAEPGSGPEPGPGPRPGPEPKVPEARPGLLRAFHDPEGVPSEGVLVQVLVLTADLRSLRWWDFWAPRKELPTKLAKRAVPEGSTVHWLDHALLDSNQRPLVLETNALPTKLSAL